MNIAVEFEKASQVMNVKVFLKERNAVRKSIHVFRNSGNAGGYIMSSRLLKSIRNSSCVPRYNGHPA